MALYTPEYQPTGDEIAVIETSQGTIRVQLAGKDAPIHVGNFVELAQKGFYDNLKFHRYVPGFVIQGGCPNTRDSTPIRCVRRKAIPSQASARAVLATPSSRSTPPTRTTSTWTGPLPWRVPRTRTRPAPSSTSAWAPSPS